MFHLISKIFTSIDLFHRAFHRHKKSILILTLLGFISGILGGVGISAIVPLFSFVSNNSGNIDDPISGVFRTIFFGLSIPFTLPVVISILVAIFIFKAIFLYAANIINAKIATEYETGIRNELFAGTINASWPHLSTHKIGYLSQVILDDVNASASLLTSISMVILSLTSLISYAIVAFGISFYVTITTILIGIILFFILKPLFYKIRKLSKKAVGIAKETAHHINQHLIGAKTVKSMAAEGRIIEKGENYFRDYSPARLELAKYNNVLGTFLEPLTLAVIIPIFLISYKDPSFNIASFAAILYLVQKMFSFVQNIQIRISLINQGIPSLLSVVNYQTEASRYLETANSGKKFSLKSEIKFEKLKFSYDKSEDVLNGISFSLRKGEMVGLIGQSGAGKTTIADLILGLLKPQEGEILIDDCNISDINLSDLRKNIGYVSQDIFLLNDTIINNIKFYDDSISVTQIEHASKAANIYDFIVQQPNKFETMVGERGLKLSAGQRQRIVLARIIARNPEVLILDEATSALDNESEVAIQKALHALRGKMTILVVAHRLSTVMNSDKVIVLDGGRISETGTPKELLADKDSYFYKMNNIRE